MAQVSKEMGVIAVLAKRMVEERLPKALALKERVDRGEVLNDLDLAFLEQVVTDATKALPLAKDNPRLRAMIENLTHTLPEQRHAALQVELDLLNRAIARHFSFSEDLALARIPDPQGLGASVRL